MVSFQDARDEIVRMSKDIRFVQVCSVYIFFCVHHLMLHLTSFYLNSICQQILFE